MGGELAHPQTIDKASLSHTSRRKNIKRRTELCQEMLTAMTQRCMGGADLVTQKGPFLSHLAISTAL